MVINGDLPLNSDGTWPRSNSPKAPNTDAHCHEAHERSVPMLPIGHSAAESVPGTARHGNYLSKWGSKHVNTY